MNKRHERRKRAKRPWRNGPRYVVSREEVIPASRSEPVRWVPRVLDRQTGEYVGERFDHTGPARRLAERLNEEAGYGAVSE
jgi:hypothetical protein